MLLKKLKERKILQYLGSYLAVGFAILQFIEFVVKRYELDNNLVDKYLLVWILLIPTVVLLTYFGWGWNPIWVKGQKQWPKIVVSGNIITAIVLAIFFFNNEAKADEPSIVEVVDENGETLQEVIPSQEKVKKIACFLFKNQSSQQKNNWWGYAFSELLSLNLEQRPDYYCYNIYGLDNYYDDASVERFTVPNVGALRKMANAARLDYFTDLSYNFKGDSIILTGVLYRTQDGKQLSTLEVSDVDPFVAIDRLRDKIFNITSNNQEISKNSSELPASALITNGELALKNYTASRIEFAMNPKAFDKVIPLAEKSIELDDNCAICHTNLGDKYYGNSQLDKAVDEMRKAIANSKSLPQRIQLYIKSSYYKIKNDMTAYYKLAEVQRKLYPYSFNAYNKLMPYYKMNYGIDSAKYLAQQAIDNGNLEKGLLALYDLELNNKEYDIAETTLNKLTKHFPDRENDYMRYANLYSKQGKLAEAKEIFEEQLLLNPLDISIQIQLSYLAFRDANSEEAFKLVEGIENASMSQFDSIRINQYKAYLNLFSGRLKEAEKYNENYNDLILKRAPKSTVINEILKWDVRWMCDAGKEDNVRGHVYKLLEPFENIEDFTICVLNTLVIYQNYASIMSVNEFKECQDIYADYGKENEKVIKALIAYEEGDYRKSVSIIDQNEKTIKKEMENSSFLAIIYLKAGEQQKAIDIMEEIINTKPQPEAYYRYALVLENIDRRKALENLNIALNYWRDADDNFVPKQRAQALKNDLLQKVNR